MIIHTNEKEFPKGFLLNKDYLLTKLFLSKKKKIIPVKTLSFQSPPIKTSLYLQINKNKRDAVKTRNFSALSNFKLQRRLKKAFLPNFSAIDFHKNFQTKGEFVLGFMDDDLNITSINSKKFYYTNQYFKSQSYKKIEDHNARITQTGSSRMTSSVPKFNYDFFSNEKLKKIKARPVTGTSWFQTELPKAK